MRNWTLLGILIGIFASPVAAKPGEACTTQLYQRADSSLVAAAAGWRTLFAHYEKFVRCDDGALAEGYSDAVVTLFARRWDQVADFRRFIGCPSGIPQVGDPAYRCERFRR